MSEDAEAFLGVKSSTGSVTAPPPSDIAVPDAGRERRAKMLTKAYFVMLGLAVLFGLLGGTMISSGGGQAADPIAILTFFILFPAFVLADAAFKAQLLFCPLRAVSLPLVEGFVIWQVADWQDPFAISVITAFIYAIASFIVAAIARARRK